MNEFASFMENLRNNFDKEVMDTYLDFEKSRIEKGFGVFKFLKEIDKLEKETRESFAEKQDSVSAQYRILVDLDYKKTDKVINIAVATAYKEICKWIEDWSKGILREWKAGLEKLNKK